MVIILAYQNRLGQRPSLFANSKPVRMIAPSSTARKHRFVRLDGRQAHVMAIFFDPFAASLGRFNVKIPFSYFALALASETAAGREKLR